MISGQSGNTFFVGVDNNQHTAIINQNQHGVVDGSGPTNQPPVDVQTPVLAIHHSESGQGSWVVTDHKQSTDTLSKPGTGSNGSLNTIPMPTGEADLGRFIAFNT